MTTYESIISVFLFPKSFLNYDEKKISSCSDRFSEEITHVFLCTGTQTHRAQLMEAE